MKTDRKIRILVADDDPVFLNLLNDYINSLDDMEVVALVDNGEDAVASIIDLKPDIALIDLIMPLKDGFGVLEDMKQRNITETACILISAIGLDSTAVKALLLGAKYFVVKPYRNEFLAGRIRQVYEEMKICTFKNSELNRYDFLSANKSVEVIAEKDTESIEHKISQLLNKMNISASIKGYYYIRSAIIMVLKDQEAIIGITKRMYPDIGREYKTSASKVERAIRHAIESAWKKGAGKFYGDMIGIKCEEKPTNGQFIAAVGEFLRLNDGEIKTA